jgi:tripeptide aminopeptidase
MVTALALSDVFHGGWFGKVVQGDKQGTSNVGRIGDKQGLSAGQATNVVTDFVRVTGESRSHDLAFASAITAAYRAAFEKAAGQVKDDQGATAQVQFESKLDYYPFRLSESEAVYQHAQKAIAGLGWESISRIANGGLDANWLVRHGIPTVTLGAGQNEIHTTQEFVDLAEFERGCQVALALATLQ